MTGIRVHKRWYLQVFLSSRRASAGIDRFTTRGTRGLVQHSLGLSIFLARYKAWTPSVLSEAQHLAVLSQ